MLHYQIKVSKFNGLCIAVGCFAGLLLPVPALSQEESGSPKIEEVLVSASYREQDAQDVVGGIQVFGGARLDRSGVTGMEDYLQQVSSVSLQKSGVGKANIAIRGISNMNSLDIGYADGSPTAGIYLNDVAIQGSGVFPDLNIFDLQRIEVLKGPQGTLYGEGSMGGAIKMITMPPNLQEWRVRTQLNYSETKEASDPNWDIRGALNVPVWEDRLALRVVGSRRFEAGFVDYPALNRDDANNSWRESLRAVMTFQATEWLELEYMYLYDYDDRDQLPVTDDGREEELVNTREENQFATTEFDVNSLTARIDLRFASLTSVSSWFNTDRETQRRIPILQNIVDTTFMDNFGTTGPETFPKAFTHVVTKLESFSQELRLVSHGDERFDWVVGVFYRDRDQKFFQDKHEEFAPDDPLGVLQLLFGPEFLALSGKQEEGFGAEPFEQKAIYGEVAWELLPAKLELTAGLRWFEDRVGFFQDTDFFGAEAAIFATDPENVEEDGSVRVFFGDELTTEDVLPKLSLAWYFNDESMIYATVSKGFRSGTPNLFSALDSGPPIVRPDFVLNKEIGAKTAWFENQLIANLGIYEIEWEDFQGLILGTADLGAVEDIPFAHLGNGGDAEVRGAELSLMYRPLESLTLSFGAGYNKGKVTEPEPDAQVSKGSELPNKPKLTWTAKVDYMRPLWGNLMGEASFAYTYVDEQLTVFQSEEDGIDGFPIDSYKLTKASLGISGMSWNLQLFGNNLTDDTIVVARSQPAPQSTVLPRRTIGVRFSYDY